MALIAAILGTCLGWLPRLPRRRAPRLARASIASAPKSTTIAADGAVHSFQSARLELPSDELRRLWTPAQLENLGRTYWRFLSHFTLGLVRVLYDENERRIVLIARPITLIRFEAPTYRFDREGGRISWRITDGLLVSPTGRRGSGFLAIEVKREHDDGHSGTLVIDVEVANFYPAIASRLGRPVYMATQSFIHVVLTHAFLRRLERLQLEQSSIRRFPE
jgi:hypothetical protein